MLCVHCVYCVHMHVHMYIHILYYIHVVNSASPFSLFIKDDSLLKGRLQLIEAPEGSTIVAEGSTVSVCVCVCVCVCKHTCEIHLVKIMF